MPRVVFEVPTFAQAKELASWYEGQGEQDAEVWFDNAELPTPITNVGRKGGYEQIDEKTETITVYCK